MPETNESAEIQRMRAEIASLTEQRNELVARVVGPVDPTDLPLVVSVDNASEFVINVHAVPLYGRVLATGEVRGPIRVKVNVEVAPLPDPRDVDPSTRPLRDMSDDALAWRTGDAVITRDWQNLWHFAVEYRERMRERALERGRLVTPIAAIQELLEQDTSEDDEWDKGWNAALEDAIDRLRRLEDPDAPWRCEKCTTINYDKLTRCYSCGTERSAPPPPQATAAEPPPSPTLGMPNPVIMRTLLTMMTPGTELHALVQEHAKRRRETAIALGETDYTFPTEETSEYPPRGVACWNCCEEDWTRDARIIVCCKACGAYLHQSNPKTGTNPWCPYHGDPPDRCICDLPDMTPEQEIAIWRQWGAKNVRDLDARDEVLDPKDVAVNALFDAARLMLEAAPEAEGEEDALRDAVRGVCTDAMNTSVVLVMCSILVEVQDQSRLDVAQRTIMGEMPS